MFEYSLAGRDADIVLLNRDWSVWMPIVGGEIVYPLAQKTTEFKPLKLDGVGPRNRKESKK